jgi:hypothetical protein
MQKDFADGAERIEEHEIGVRINGAKHASVHLIHEFLTIVGVAFRRLRIGYSVRSTEAAARLSTLRLQNGVTILSVKAAIAALDDTAYVPMAGETIDLGESASNDDTRIVEGRIQERAISCRGADLVLVGLINQDHDLSGKLGDERLQVFARS